MLNVNITVNGRFPKIMAENYENTLFIPGITRLGPTPVYNRQPLQLWNPFEAAFGYSDDKYFKERAKACAVHGAYVGFFPVTFFNTMKYHLTDNSMFFNNSKKLFLLSSFKYTVVGGLTGATYLGGVRLASELRGNKDDWINHYIGGFFFMIPMAIYRQSLRTLVMGGAYMSLFTALCKYLYTEQVRLVNFDYETEGRVTNCRYPEAYLASLSQSTPKGADIRAAIDYQRKDGFKVGS